MLGRRSGVPLVAGVVLMTAGALSAQQRQVSPTQPSIMNDEADQPTTPSPPPSPRRARTQITAPALQADPDIDTEDQFAPSQIRQPMPSAVAEPSPGPGHKNTYPPKHAAAAATTEEAPAKPAHVTAGRTVVACSGPFAKDSSMLGLAMAFDSRNVTFTQIDGGSVGKVMASVLYPKDPKRRLEVWWSDPASRTGTYLIVINGQSAWTAPGGVRLGQTLQELDKLNHKPFKLKGFNKDNIATVSDWDGGALGTLAGGCKFGLSLHADPKAPADAVSALPADKEFSSADPAIRAAKPRVSEILIGY